ncbi:hypothetical protein [Brevibacillus choshinensis]|uniref:hypothetical protein n=1 Tax=Brevibacillus choshinensis TaxID=54911 RepID=UPI002E1FE97A|nr:hypothetical protein [Brevibacillus choshinensis]
MTNPRKKAQIRLSPPEATYFNEIKFSIGNDPLVRVEPLIEMPGGNFRITLHVQGTQKARALATLLVRTKQIGNLRIHVRVKTTEGNVVQPISRTLSPREIANLYRVAFRTNRLFNFAMVRASISFTAVYPVFKAQVIQFFNDDLSDLFNNFNRVAAFVFRDVLRNTINRTPILFSTARKKMGSTSHRK